MNRIEFTDFIADIKSRHRKNRPMPVKYYLDTYKADHRHVEVVRAMYPRAVQNGNVYGPETGILRIRKTYRGTPLLSIGKRVLSRLDAMAAGTKIQYSISRKRLILEVAK